MKYKLLIKKHCITGLKYLCVTTKEDYVNYAGSGTLWKQHLKKNGKKIETILIFETDDKNKFIEECYKKSHEFDIVNSSDWANTVIEGGGCEKYPQYRTEVKTSDEYSKWFQCSICNAVNTKLIFVTGHKKCKQHSNFNAIAIDIDEWKTKNFLK